LKPQEAVTKLYDRYASLVSINLLSLLFLGLHLKCHESGLWSDALSATRGALVAVSAISTAMIPYVYGKLVDPALFPNAFLQYLEDNPAVMNNQGKKIPGGSPLETGGAFPVISQSDKSVLVLSIKRGSGVTALIEIPRNKIISISYTADVDVLAKIAECRKGAGTQCQ
jgi:hypothetical protein